MSCFKKNFVIIMLQLLFVSLSVAQSDDLSLKQLCENSNSAIVAETGIVK